MKIRRAINPDNGSILALTLILGSAVSVLALSLIHYSFIEVQTAEGFEKAQEFQYLAWSGIETGLAVLNQNPGRTDSFKYNYGEIGSEEGSFEVTYLFSDSPYDDENFLPRGYSGLGDLKEEEVFIVSRAATGEENWENYLELWALVAKAPLFEPVLTAHEVLRLEGLSDISGESENRAGIYGSVHLDGSLIVDSGPAGEYSFIRREVNEAVLPKLTYGITEPRRSFLYWHNSFGVPALFVEQDEFTSGVIYLDNEGICGGGAYFRRYNPIDFNRRFSLGRIGFSEVPPLRFSYENFKDELLANAETEYPERMVELSGNLYWDNDSIESYNDKIIHIKGDLTVENTFNEDEELITPLLFEGVIIVEGRLTFLHKRRENSGSIQHFKGVIMAEELICTYDDPEVMQPEDEDTLIILEGLAVIKDKAEIISSGSADTSMPKDLRRFRGNLIGREIRLGGPHTAIYHEVLEDVTGDYYSIIPHTGFVIRKLFKPYMG